MNISSNRLVGHTSVYVLGDILRYSTSLIMLPIYTRYLTPEDFGVVELLSMLIDFASIIFGARVGQSVFRFYCTTQSDDEKKNVIASALLLGVVFNGIGALTIIISSAPLAAAIFSDPSYQRYIVLFSITMLLLPLIEIPLVHIRAQQRPWLFFIFSMAKLIIQVGLNIYLVVYLEMHVDGVVYSAVISSIVMAVVLMGYSLPKAGMCATIATCKKLFSFSLPLKLATIGSFYATFGDRFVLNIFTDLSQVGIYALGYKFGFIFTMVSWTPFEKVWDAEKYHIYERPNAKQNYRKIFLYISCILIFLGLCISILTRDLLRIMADPAFLDAYKIVPIIIIAYIFQAWTKYCSLGMFLKDKTIQIAHAELVTALVITVAYFTLIPAFGLYGAAWATVAGFAARFFWTNHKAIQLYNMELPWNRVAAVSILALIFYFLSLMSPENLLLSIAVRCALLISFGAALFVLPIFSSNEKREIYDTILSFRRSAVFPGNNG